MNPKDLQKMMNAAKQSDHQMSQDEFNKIFETMKQGKSPEEEKFFLKKILPFREKCGMI